MDGGGGGMSSNPSGAERKDEWGVGSGSGSWPTVGLPLLLGMARPRSPALYLLAGPNGAGKTSAAGPVLASRVPMERFVNADQIAMAINASDPLSVRGEAGRVALRRVEALVREKLDFAFETTLSGRRIIRLVHRLLADGWTVDLSFLWLPTAEASVARVRLRVERQQGHHVPGDDVRRRFTRGLINFDALRETVSAWRVVDRRTTFAPRIIASGGAGELAIRDPDAWSAVLDSIRTARRAQVREPVSVPVRSPERLLGDDPERCFAAADRATVLRHRALGIPLVVWRDGGIVEADPWTIEVPGVVVNEVVD